MPGGTKGSFRFIRKMLYSIFYGFRSNSLLYIIKVLYKSIVDALRPAGSITNLAAPSGGHA